MVFFEDIIRNPNHEPFKAKPNLAHVVNAIPSSAIYNEHGTGDLPSDVIIFVAYLKTYSI